MPLRARCKHAGFGSSALTLQLMWVQAESMGTKHRDFKVLCSDAVRNRFIECDQSKNTFGSEYHVRECQTQELPMAFPDFAQCAERWTSRRLYFKVRTPPPRLCCPSTPLCTARVPSEVLQCAWCAQGVVMARLHAPVAAAAGSVAMQASAHLGAHMKAELAGRCTLIRTAAPQMCLSIGRTTK